MLSGLVGNLKVAGYYLVNFGIPLAIAWVATYIVKDVAENVLGVRSYFVDIIMFVVVFAVAFLSIQLVL